MDNGKKSNHFILNCKYLEKPINGEKQFCGECKFFKCSRSVFTSHTVLNCKKTKHCVYCLMLCKTSSVYRTHNISSCRTFHNHKIMFLTETQKQNIKKKIECREFFRIMGNDYYNRDTDSYIEYVDDDDTHSLSQRDDYYDDYYHGYSDDSNSYYESEDESEGDGDDCSKCGRINCKRH